MIGKIPAAVLGATGAVGQRLISLLAEHPWFEIVVVTGSKRSAGQVYSQATQWLVPGQIPPALRDMVICSTEELPEDVPLAFSALPASVARQMEPELASRGHSICSNASALRMEPDVPLIIPEINASHLAMIKHQRERRGWRGMVVTSPNCAVTGIVFPLKALHDAFGVRQVYVVTMQALSGAGYPGVASLDLFDNIIPYISGEESKIENEPRKLLGTMGEEGLQLAPLLVSAQANRVPVVDGHLAALSVEFSQKPSLEEVHASLAAFEAPPNVRDLPSAPDRPLLLHSGIDRPQPRLDRMERSGMAVSVGRVQPCSVLDYKMVSLVHNTLRGAASGAILNAELMVAEGHLGPVPS